jgi:hypothetical protein
VEVIVALEHTHVQCRTFHCRYSNKMAPFQFVCNGHLFHVILARTVMRVPWSSSFLPLLVSSNSLDG